MDGSSYPESEWFHGRRLSHSLFPVRVRLRLYYETDPVPVEFWDVAT